MRYRQYIASDAWLTSPARYEALRSARFRCRICNAPSSEIILQVHHRTYVNLGDESPDDLTALCRDCHHDVHNFLRARLYAKLAPPTALDVVITARAPLFDASFAGEAA